VLSVYLSRLYLREFVIFLLCFRVLVLQLIKDISSSTIGPKLIAILFISFTAQGIFLFTASLGWYRRSKLFYDSPNTDSWFICRRAQNKNADGILFCYTSWQVSLIWIIVRVMVFNATFNNIRSVLLVEEGGVHGENHWPAASHWQTLSHNVVSSTPHHERDSNSNYDTIMTTTTPI
jgi:hypothetical protein